MIKISNGFIPHERERENNVFVVVNIIVVNVFLCKKYN